VTKYAITTNSEFEKGKHFKKQTILVYYIVFSLIIHLCTNVLALASRHERCVFRRRIELLIVQLRVHSCSQDACTHCVSRQWRCVFKTRGKL